VQDQKLYGKPRDLKAARSMLKKLTRKPQWVYTGIAVVDKDKNKILVSYEKTKVYMDKLTDKEISGYFKRVSPVDKAGSFDIQGKGALFVRRIEGCFYNVVGLPLRKLYLILKRLGIKSLVFMFCLINFSFCFILSGCSTEYNVVTGKEEFYFYSTDKEVQIGKSIAKAVESEYKLVDDPLVQKRVQDIGKRIAAVSDRKEVDYRFKVLDEDEVNAFALPGGFIYVNKGLLEKVSSDDELAGVLGHEVGHIVAKHSVKKLQTSIGMAGLNLLGAVAKADRRTARNTSIAITELMMAYNRQAEFEADKLSVTYLKEAGFDPKAAVSLIDRLLDRRLKGDIHKYYYFRTHPYPSERRAMLNKEIEGSFAFDDYINAPPDSTTQTRW